MGVLSRLIADETGATMIEYGLVASLVAVVCIAAVKLVGLNTSQVLFSQIAQSI